MNNPSPYLTINEMCKLLGIDTLEKIMEDMFTFDNFSHVYSIKLEEARRRGLSEEEAEKSASVSAEEYENEETDKYLTKYKNAVLSVIEELFGYHDLVLVHSPKKNEPNRWMIQPKNTNRHNRPDWTEPLAKIVKTINDYGQFHFHDIIELLRSGPYLSTRIGVLNHKHWVLVYNEIYEGTKARSMVERKMRQ